jgi:hypothetical protein
MPGRLQSQAPELSVRILSVRIWLPIKFSTLAAISVLTGNSPDRCRKRTFAGEKLRVSAFLRPISCLLSIAAMAIHLPLPHMENERYALHRRKYFAATRTQKEIRSGSFSQRRNGSCFRHMAARPFTLSEFWRYLAAQTNTFPALFRLWFLGWVRPDRGDPPYFGRP